MATSPGGTDRIAQLEKLLTLDPLDAFVLYGLAQEHAKQGNSAKSIDFYDKCIAADSTYCYAYYHKARVQQDADDITGAINTVKAGIAVAKKVQDMKASSELAALLDMLE